MCVVKKTNNVPSRLPPIRQWPHDVSCTWAHVVQFHSLEMCSRASCAQLHELPRGHWRIGNNRDGKLSVFLTIFRKQLYE